MDDRRPQVDSAQRLDDAFGHLVAARDAPKMLMKIASRSRRVDDLERARITSDSRPSDVEKLAARPPLWFTTSSVLMARPAPFAMIPTEPSSRCIEGFFAGQSFARVESAVARNSSSS